MVKCLVIGMLIILSISSFAQTVEPFCGTDAIYQNNPLLKQELINKTLALRNAKLAVVDPNMVFTVPVVFIVYHLGEAVGTGSNVSDANINTTLQYINQAFRAQGSFTSGADVKIQFQLAKYDNQCTASSGIVRINASGIPNYSSGFASTDVAMQNQLRALTPTWSENNCIIIRLVNNMTDYGGYSYFWNDMFVESVYANGNISASLLFTHELGHSFSLYHTFQGDNNGANCPPNSDPDNQGDYISDTQPHKINDNCSFQSTADINSCTGIAFGTVLLNHMSYSNSCKDRFTPKQIERMRNGLVGFRPNWVNSQALTGQSNIPTPIASGAAVCGPSSVTLSATGCNGTYNWYSASSGGNSLGTASSYTTPSISTTTTYYVSCNIGNCTSTRASAVATINNLPSSPTIAPVSINSGQTATLTASNCNNGTVKWYNANTGGNLLFTGNPYGMLMPTTTTTYYASCTVSSCESTRGSGTITVNVCNISEPITIGSSRCGAGSVLLSASNCGGTYNWYSASSGGNSLGTASSYTTPSISTTTTYYVSCTVGNCTSTRASAVATINNLPSSPTIAPVSINSGQTASLTASNCSGTVSWYSAVTGSNFITSGASYTTPALTTTTTYYATCMVSGCESTTRSSGTVTVTTSAFCFQKSWDKTIGGSSSDAAQAIIATTDGGFIVAGSSWSGVSSDKTEANRGSSDYWVLKLNSIGQKVWDKTIGGSGDDQASSIVATSDGGFVITGWSDSGISGDKTEANKGGTDYWIVKINSNGQRVWDKTIGGSGFERSNSIVATSDGGFVVAGWSNSGISGDKTEIQKGSNDYWIVKLNSNGQKVWDKTLGGSANDEANEIIASSDGGFVMAGHSNSGISGDKTEASKGFNDYWIVKLNSNGQKVWDKTLGGSNNDYVNSIVLVSDGGFVVTGYSDSGVSGDKTEANKGGSDYWTIKLNSNGQKIWDKTLGGNNGDYALSITTTSEGEFVVLGYSSSVISGDKTEISKGVDDYWITKLSSNGQKVCDQTIGGNSYDYAESIIPSLDGGLVVAGWSTSGVSGDKTESLKGGSDFWIVKLGGCTPPAAPTVASVSINSGQTATLTASNCTGSVKWYNQQTGGTLLFTGNPYVTGALSANATYYASCTVNNCESTTRGSGTVTVNCTPPAAPTVNSVSINSGQTATLTASNCSGSVKWYSDATGGMPLFTGNPYVTGALSANATYYASCTVNNCESTTRGSGIVTVNPVNNPCPPTIIHGTGVLAAGTYQAGQTIDSKANISTPTTYTAGQSILLSTGFNAGPNETFLAMIGGCATAPTNGLVAYYTFSGNANDGSGNDYHGTVDGAILATDRKGEANKAYSFNGVNGRIRVEDTPNLNFSSSFSISFWAKINAWGNSNNIAPGIVSKKASDQNVGYVIYNDGFYLNKINFRLKGSSSQDYMPSNTSVSIGVWECWTMVYNSTDGTNKLFRNGILDKSYLTGNLGNMSSTAPLYFGYSQTWNGYLNGLLDEIRIYNRAITNDEVLQIYNVEKP